MAQRTILCLFLWLLRSNSRQWICPQGTSGKRSVMPPACTCHPRCMMPFDGIRSTVSNCAGGLRRLSQWVLESCRLSAWVFCPICHSSGPLCENITSNMDQMKKVICLHLGKEMATLFQNRGSDIIWNKHRRSSILFHKTFLSFFKSTTDLCWWSTTKS